MKYIVDIKFNKKIKFKAKNKLERIFYKLIYIAILPFLVFTSFHVYIHILLNKSSIFRLSLNGDKLSLFLPNLNSDYTQQFLFFNKSYYEFENMVKVLDFLPENCAHIVDVGANIGNHSIYYSKSSKVLKTFSFEPIPDTFKILKKNIELNNLNDTVSLFNLGLSDCNGFAKIENYNLKSIGSTSLIKSKDGNIELKAFDDINLDNNRLDLVKIDVEGYEKNVIKGMEESLKLFSPIIQIEIFVYNFKDIKDFLENLGYHLQLRFDETNFLFIKAK